MRSQWRGKKPMNGKKPPAEPESWRVAICLDWLGQIKTLTSSKKVVQGYFMRQKGERKMY